MLKKMIVLSLVMFFVCSGISYAADIPNPFAGLTQDQVVQKYFEGRQIEPIEGVWLSDYFQPRPEIIIKASLIDFNNVDNYDYLKVQYSSSANTGIIGIRKTQYPSVYRIGKDERSLRFISSTALVELSGAYYSQNFHKFYTRIYPTEVK